MWCWISWRDLSSCKSIEVWDEVKLFSSFSAGVWLDWDYWWTPGCQSSRMRNHRLRRVLVFSSGVFSYLSLTVVCCSFQSWSRKFIYHNQNFNTLFWRFDLITRSSSLNSFKRSLKTHLFFLFCVTICLVNKRFVLKNWPLLTWGCQKQKPLRIDL